MKTFETDSHSESQKLSIHSATGTIENTEMEVIKCKLTQIIYH
jgi:hypothetical protein